MTYEKSCGALVFRHGDDDREYILMIRQKKGGNRSFPKGHVEQGESEHETAIREVCEETGVEIKIKSKFRRVVSYSPMPGVMKNVVYFISETDKLDIRPREGEIASVEWVPVDEAEKKLSYENDKNIFRKAVESRQKYLASKRFKSTV